MEFNGAGAKVSGADGAVASSPTPDVVVVEEVDRSFSRDTSQDTEPVSISDLEAVFQPGHAPPLWAGSSDDPAAPGLAPASDREVSSSPPPRSSESAAASLRRMEELVGGALPAENPSSARSILAPVLLAVSRTSDAPPVSSQPLSDRELLFEQDKPDTAPPPAMKKRKPSFFDVDDALSPRAHLFDAAPAPFDPHVPALPGRLNLDDDDENNPDSGLVDIRRLAARESENKKKKKNAARASEDIFNLSGGLFAGGASAPLVAPDLNALIAPVVSESSRPSAPPRAAAVKPAERISGAPAAAVLARPRPLVASAVPQRGARAGLMAAIAVVGVGLALAAFKMGSSSPTGTTAETAPPVSAVETAKPALPIATTPPAVSPEPAATARDPGAPAKREKDPVAATTATAATPATSTPRAQAPSPVGAGAAPVVAAPVVAAPVAAPPPPPPAAAEFSKSAAIAALAAAAGRASACKQPDDPSGGASVSITFAPSGRVTSSKVSGPPFQGTKTGGCIAAAFRSATVPPFEGSPVTVTKNVSVR